MTPPLSLPERELRAARTRLALVTLVLAATGAVLGLPYAPGGATLVFVVAALGAFGTRAGAVLGALTLTAGLATAPAYQPTLMLPAIGMGLAGLGLGLLARELDRLSQVLPSALLSGALVALIGGVTLALPEVPVLLASADGAPLVLPALVVDGASFMRVAVDLPGLALQPNPVGSLSAIALLASLIAALVLVIVHLRGPAADVVGRAERRGAWELAGIAALLGLVVALAGFAQLLFGSVSQATDAETWRHALDLAASRDGAVIDIAMPSGVGLRLWSRPWLDGLHLLPSLALMWLSIRELRKSPADGVSVASVGTFGLSRLTPIAMALTAIGTALIAATHGLQGTPLALAAGLVLGLGAVVSGRTWIDDAIRRPAVPALAPLLALGASALVWVYAWLVTPLFGA